MTEMGNTLNITELGDEGINYLSKLDKYLDNNNFFDTHKFATIFCNLDTGTKIFPDKNITKIKIANIIPPFVDLNETINDHKYYIFISTKNSFKDNEVIIL